MNDPSSPFSTPPSQSPVPSQPPPTPPPAPAELPTAPNPAPTWSPPPSASPYQSPPIPSPYATSAPTLNTDYVSVQGKAQATIILLGIGIVLEIVSFFSTIAQLNLLSRINSASEAEISANDIREGIVALFQFGVIVATGILFLMWMYRAHRNLKAFRAQGLEFTSGWAVGYFFVPFINLVRPYHAMQEIWKASDPNIPTSDGLSWKNSFVPPVFGWWWGAYIISNIVSQAVMRVSFNAETPDALIRSSQLTLVSVPFSIVSAVLAMVIVKEVTERQVAKANQLSAVNSPQNPAPFVY